MAGMTDDFFNNQFNELFVPKSYGYSVDEPHRQFNIRFKKNDSLE